MRRLGHERRLTHPAATAIGLFQPYFLVGFHPAARPLLRLHYRY
jgi:hypothetical protein